MGEVYLSTDTLYDNGQNENYNDANLEEQQSQFDEHLSEKEAQVQELSTLLYNANAGLYNANTELERYKASYESMRNSRFWRITLPFQRFVNNVRNLKSNFTTPSAYIENSDLFDKDWYIEQYPNINGNVAEHYLNIGWKNNFDPSKSFSTEGYLKCNPDVAHVGMNPLLHYITYGKAENRQMFPSSWIDGMSSEDYIGHQLLQQQQEEVSEEEALERISSYNHTPLISVIMPMHNPNMRWLDVAISSIQKQYYQNWELCITYDESSNISSVKHLQKMADSDTRLKLFVQKEGPEISSASNVSLHNAAGEFIALVDQEDALPPDALFWVIDAINVSPSADFLYTDECKINVAKDAIYSDFFFKPDWSPEMMINYMYTGHLTVYRRALVEKLGGFNSEYDFSQDYDLALRVSENTSEIVHIERILYFWRTLSGIFNDRDKNHSKPQTMESLREHYRRLGVNVDVSAGLYGQKIKLLDRPEPKISIIVPSNDEKKIVTLIDIIRENTAYKKYEIVVVGKSKLCKKIERKYAQFIFINLIKTVVYNKKFNFSAMCNTGAKNANGNVFLFLNDNTFPNQDNWAEPMLDLLFLPGIGGVSPVILHDDQQIECDEAQVMQPSQNIFSSIFHYEDIDAKSNMFINPQPIHNVSVLSGACLMVQKTIFNEVHGFDIVNTPNRYSNVDISIRIWQAGYRCVYTPYAPFMRNDNEAISLSEPCDKVNLYVMGKWSSFLNSDPFFTKSIQKFHYGNISLPYELHLPENCDKPANSHGNILLISHELSRTGAPVVVQKTTRLLKKAGYFVVVASPFEGAVMNDLLADDIPVIVDHSLSDYRWYPLELVPKELSKSLQDIIREFDLVIINSFSCHNIISAYNGSDVPILWWLHEGYASFLNGNNRFMPKHLESNIRVVCGGKYVIDALRYHDIDYDLEEFLYGIEDISDDFYEELGKKVRFIFPGSYEPRKNQKLLLQAIENLPPLLRKKSEFICIGTYWDEEFYNSLKEYAGTIENVSLLDPIPYNELMDFYNTCDCIIVPSVDDPMPVVLTEALMLSKIVLCSTMTGTARYIVSGENGFTFDSNDADSLTNHLKYIIENRNNLQPIKDAGRKTYETVFSMDIFERNLLDQISRKPITE